MDYLYIHTQSYIYRIATFISCHPNDAETAANSKGTEVVCESQQTHLQCLAEEGRC